MTDVAEFWYPSFSGRRDFVHRLVRHSRRLHYIPSYSQTMNLRSRATMPSHESSRMHCTVSVTAFELSLHQIDQR